MKYMKFIIKRKILIGLLVMLVLMTGTYSMLKLDKELMPSIDFDGAYVSLYAGELSAMEVERNITNILENRLLALSGVEEVQSVSSIGRSSINIIFERGRGDELYREIQSVVASTTPEMSGVIDVTTGRFGTNQDYEFFMDVSNGELEEMTHFTKHILRPRLESLPEVRDVLLVGTLEKEITISFLREKMNEHGLGISEVIGYIQASNSEATLGEFIGEENTPTVRWNSQITDINGLENLIIPTAQGNVPLKDIAVISLNTGANTSTIWKNGTKDFVFVQVGRVSGVTQIEMANAIRTEIQAIEEEGLINGFTLNEMVAQADYVQEAIDGVSSNILIGAVIAVAILLLFLRNFRATLIVAISIPTSILLTFTFMWLFDYSVNMLTLIGLGLGIGMMVDASIVILESIYRKKQQGYHNLSAVLEGTKEVATAVIASMLTTIVVFLPIGLVAGEIGEFIIILSAIVVITLLSSVIISFTLIPTLAQKVLKLGKGKKIRESGKLLKAYIKILSWIVKKKRNSFAVILLFLFLFASSLFLVPKIPMSIMPDFYNRYNELAVELENGVPIEEKELMILAMNESLLNIQDVETSYIMDYGNTLYLMINMTRDENITREQKKVNEEILSSLRDLQENYPIKSVQGVMSEGGGYPVQINIKGEDIHQLTQVAQDMIIKLERIEGVVGLTHSAIRTTTEVVVEIKEKEVADAGLLPLTIQQIIMESFMHVPVGEIKTTDESLPLFVKYEEIVEGKHQLLKIQVPTMEGEKELSHFINLKSVNTPNEIRHLDGERYISIMADIEGKDLGSINRDIQAFLADYDTPNGFTISLAGDLEKQQEIMLEMLLVLSTAIFLVYLVMAVQFNHLVHPLIVMSVIPVTIIGVILGLFITQMELNVLSAMGVVMLIGIVLNNAILLIDRTNKLRNEGYNVQDALIEAGRSRIRPIFMTTLTTSGGMLPLAIASGFSGNYQAPMATVVISGLLFSTFITLVLIPAVYRIVTIKNHKELTPTDSAQVSSLNSSEAI